MVKLAASRGIGVQKIRLAFHRDEDFMGEQDSIFIHDCG
jgi:hypothetical protein